MHKISVSWSQTSLSQASRLSLFAWVFTDITSFPTLLTGVSVPSVLVLPHPCIRPVDKGPPDGDSGILQGRGPTTEIVPGWVKSSVRILDSSFPVPTLYLCYLGLDFISLPWKQRALIQFSQDVISPRFIFMFFLHSNPLTKIKPPIVLLSASLCLPSPSQASPKSPVSERKYNLIFSRNTKVPETRVLTDLSHLGVVSKALGPPLFLKTPDFTPPQCKSLGWATDSFSPLETTLKVNWLNLHFNWKLEGKEFLKVELKESWQVTGKDSPSPIPAQALGASTQTTVSMRSNDLSVIAQEQIILFRSSN